MAPVRFYAGGLVGGPARLSVVADTEPVAQARHHVVPVRRRGADFAWLALVGVVEDGLVVDGFDGRPLSVVGAQETYPHARRLNNVDGQPPARSGSKGRTGWPR